MSPPRTKSKPERQLTNAEIALHFDELGDLYELDGAIVHRVVVYRTAAKAVREATASVADLAAAGRAQELPGIGKTLAEKIDVLIATGSIPSAEKLKQKFPAGLVEITRLPGLGPKRARKLFDELDISSLEQLRHAAETEQLRTLPGFGAKSEQTILEALDAGADGSPQPRLLLSKALDVAEALAEALRAHPAAERVEIAGSARRWSESCKDLDLVAASDDAGALAAAFVELPLIAEASRPGEAGARALTHNGVAVDLRIVAPATFGSLLQHLTGSKQHNEALRTAAVKRGLHVSEYGVLDDADGETRSCASEEEVYELLGMDWIPPELRENRGELEAARKRELPELVRVEDIRGELHSHTVASDGHYTIEEMAAGARERGYDYLAITDHSASHGFGDDVQPDQLRETIEQVRALNAELDDFELLAGTEVNITTDGSLDYEDDLLAELDWVNASVHTSFRMSEQEMTKRVLDALEHPLVDALGHPTGRLIGRREPYAIDLEQVAAAAVETGTFLEINANPNRRDLDELNARLAVEAGAKLVICADAHRIETLANTRYGIATARRAWLTADDIANTQSWKQLDKQRKKAAKRK